MLSIVIPVYNEALLVPRLLEQVLVADTGCDDKEIIVVDDGSTDDSVTEIEQVMAKHPGESIRLFRHESNLGKGAAVKTGMREARGEIVIIQDADLEYDPSEIREVLQPILNGHSMVVYGSRVLREKAMGRSGVCGLITGKHPHSYVLAYLGGVAITKFTNWLTGASLTDEPTCYKCFHRSVLADIEIECDDFAWEPEVTMKVLKAGWKIAEVPISYHPRKNREGKKINWKDGVKALWTVWIFR